MSSSEIQYLECPHCHSTVMFRAHGTCPSCQKNRFDNNGVKPNETMVIIEHNHRLPDCCFLCGEETNARKKLSWSYYTGSRSSWISLAFSYIPGSQHRAIHRITMPVCSSCTSHAKRVKPLSVVTGLSCRVLVHRNFRGAFEKLNGKESIEWECDVRIDYASGEAEPTIGKDLSFSNIGK